MTTCLVTGGAGFIGSNFVRYLLARDESVRVVTLDALTYAGNRDNLRGLGEDGRHVFVHGDIGDRALVSALLERYDPDRVINFAAETHVDRSITGPEAFARTNVLGTVNLLECCREAWSGPETGGRMFLQVSTDEVYGALGAEGRFTEDSPIRPSSPYAASKAAADCFALAFRHTYGLPVCVTRCSNNYGPRQFPEKLIPLMISRAVRHRRLPVYGDGLQVRDWLYVEDHCAAIDLVSRRGKPGEVYNVGGRCEHTNADIVRILLARLRDRLGDSGIGEHLIDHVADRPGHDRRYAIDASKLTAELGWQPATPFAEGIRMTVDWYLANRAWLDRAAGADERVTV